jgi:uncharacterized membrane protein HdeD (DUF308 family)
MKFVRYLAIVASIAFGCWLSGYVMLYGGIVQAINAFQVDPTNVGQAVAGILKAIFFECGFYAGILIAMGLAWCLEGDW